MLGGASSRPKNLSWIPQDQRSRHSDAWVGRRGGWLLYHGSVCFRSTPGLAVLDLAPGTHHYHPVDQDDLSLLVLIEDVIRRYPTQDYQRVTEQLQLEGFPVNEKLAYRVMQENDLVMRSIKRATTIT